jgi:hypothetical protein
VVLYPRAGSMWRSEAPPAPSVGSASVSSVGCLVREAGWVSNVRAALGGRRWRRPRAFARELCLHPFAVEQPAAENVGRPRLAVLSFYVRLALATLALRETSSAVTPAFRFSSLCRLISSPPQPFWEFLSRVLFRWVLMLSPSSPCPLIPFVTSQSCPVTLVLKRYLTIPIQR